MVFYIILLVPSIVHQMMHKIEICSKT